MKAVAVLKETHDSCDLNFGVSEKVRYLCFVEVLRDYKEVCCGLQCIRAPYFVFVNSIMIVDENMVSGDSEVRCGL